MESHVPPLRINQDNGLKPVDILHLPTLPGGGYMLMQEAVSSLGKQSLQIIRLEEQSLPTLIKTLQTLQALQTVN